MSGRTLQPFTAQNPLSMTHDFKKWSFLVSLHVQFFENAGLGMGGIGCFVFGVVWSG